MSESNIEEILHTLNILIETDDPTRILDYLNFISAADRNLVLTRLEPDHYKRLLTVLPSDIAADLIEALPDAQAVEFIEDLTPEEAAPIVEEMDSDEQADLLGDLEAPDAEAILEKMDVAESNEARELLRYSPDSAGGLMIKEFLAYCEDLRIQDVLDDLKGNSETFAEYDVQYVYVTNSNGLLTGVLQLRDILFALPSASLKSSMITTPTFVHDNMPLENLHAFFDANHFMAVPVTNDRGVLVGVIKREDVQEALAKDSDDKFLKFSGIIGGDEFRSMSLKHRGLKRLPWLSINILLNILAASVIARHLQTIEQVIALAVFLPIISDMSGCSGNQAVGVSIRELSMGLIKPSELLRIIIKESTLGLIIGLVLGLILGFVAWIWMGNPYLGVVVGGALSINTLLSVCMGGLLPLILKRCKVDPALVSSPLLTTVTDMCGFLLVLNLATAFLKHL